MKILLFISSLLVGSTSFAENCNWGFNGATEYTCGSETFLSGSAACDSGFYSRLFCNTKFEDDGQACANDNSVATMKCYEKMIGPTKNKPPVGIKRFGGKADSKDDEGFCNWGFDGPKIVVCNGKRFCAGVAACRNKIYHNLFCAEEFCESGKACAADESNSTVQCYLSTSKTPSKSGSSEAGESKSRVKPKNDFGGVK
jgi:hypothetical protein